MEFLWGLKIPLKEAAESRGLSRCFSNFGAPRKLLNVRLVCVWLEKEMVLGMANVQRESQIAVYSTQRERETYRDDSDVVIGMNYGVASVSRWYESTCIPEMNITRISRTSKNTAIFQWWKPWTGLEKPNRNNLVLVLWWWILLGWEWWMWGVLRLVCMCCLWSFMEFYVGLHNLCEWF